MSQPLNPRIKNGNPSLNSCMEIVAEKRSFQKFIWALNIINFAANEEIIPELLQSKCNPKNIFNIVSDFLDNPSKIEKQVNKTQITLNKIKIDKPSSELASQALNRFV